MIYFTADTHFDHANIIRFCNRPFATVDEMNDTLIANWNRKVHGNDTVTPMDNSCQLLGWAAPPAYTDPKQANDSSPSFSILLSYLFFHSPF